ncbi:MAG TPA: hypothetical protein VFJ43_10025, partial [Bacteroidia bacterium]|nr:hypothetical protein [Bacteroidia bacterium]
ATVLVAQVPKYKVLDEKDPIIGDWEWIKDPTSSPYSAIPNVDFIFLRFAAGTKVSLGAVSFDTTKGFGCPTYFLAYTNGTSIVGTITDCCVATDKGKKINFTYSYDASEDQLIITVKEEKYYYKRKN